MRKLQQPTHYTCCQTCLAVLSKKTVREVVDIVDISGIMTKPKIIEALKKLKIKHKRLKYSHGVVKNIKKALVQIVNRRQKISHLIIKKNTKIYDPWYGEIFNLEKYTKKQMKGFVYNWYIELGGLNEVL